MAQTATRAFQHMGSERNCRWCEASVQGVLGRVESITGLQYEVQVACKKGQPSMSFG